MGAFFLCVLSGWFLFELIQCLWFVVMDFKIFLCAHKCSI